jgi:hypothetical protein
VPRWQGLVEFAHVFAHFVFPVRPVVTALGAPVVDGVTNALAGEDFGEAIGGAAVLPLARTGDEVNVASGELAVIPGIGEIGEIVDGIVEIKILVVEAVHEIAQIVDAGHGEAAFEHIRMTKERVGGVIGAEGSAHGGDGDVGLAIIPDEGDDFLGKIGIENGLDVTAMKRVGRFVVEAEAVDGIDGVELDAAGIDEFGESADHALAFEFPLVARASRKPEDGRAIVAVNDDAEIETETRGVPAMIFAFHERASSLVCGG